MWQPAMSERTKPVLDKWNTQTWYWVVTSLSIQVALEKKQGISQLELLCTEIELEERNKELKKEMKRKKKKKSKQIKQQKHKEGSPDVIGVSITLHCQYVIYWLNNSHESGF